MARPTQLRIDVKAVTIGGTPLTVAPDVINSLTGLTASAAELNLLDGAGARVASGTQAAAINAISTTAGEMTQAERQAFNAALAALRAFGIIAT
jgi:hypothetical protein